MKTIRSVDRSAASVVDNAWSDLRKFTDARIGLGRAGVSLPTAALLEFQLAHAQAQDAVHTQADFTVLNQSLQPQRCLVLHSQATDRAEYLQRPDLGRVLDEGSRALCENASLSSGYDLAVVIADGLSARAVNEHAATLTKSLLQRLAQSEVNAWNVAPICLVQQGRVAVGDDIAKALSAQMVLVLIGERPGLSSPDSLGAYLSWEPEVGLPDSRRNCVSNIRPAGLPIASAADKLGFLIKEARKRKISGVSLKDTSISPALGENYRRLGGSFLTPAE